MELRQRTADVGIADYLRVLYRRRIVAILTFLAVVISVAVHTFLMTPIYEAFSMVQIKEEATENLLLKELMRLNRSNPVAAEMEIIRSRSVAEAVVRNLNLDVMVVEQSPDLKILLKNVNLSPERRGKTLEVEFIDDHGRFAVRYKGDQLAIGDATNGCRGAGLHFELETTAMPKKAAWFKFVQRPFDATVMMVQNNLGVTEVGDKTNIVKIDYRSQFPELARDIVNQTVEVYRQQNIDEKSREASLMLGFIESQLDVVRDSLDLSEDDLRRYKQENKIAALSQESNALIDAVAKFEVQRAQLQIELFKYRTMLDTFHNQGVEQLSLPSMSSTEDTVLTSLGMKLAELKAKKGSLLSDLTENAPEVQAVNSEIAAVGKQIEQVLVETVSNMQSRLTRLSGIIDAYTEQVSNLPEKERALAGLMRSSEVTSQIYTFLLQKHEETRIAKASTIGNIRVIDLAVTPKTPIKPNVRLNLLLGLVAGLLLALGLAFFLEFIDDSLKSIEEVERFVNRPIYGVIPRIPDYRKEKEFEGSRTASAALVTQHSPKSPISEAFRTLRTNIHFADPDRKLCSLLITSAGPSEGKSTIVCNLALTMANIERKTLLIDCDLRKPNVHNFFEFDRDPGLTTVLSHEASWRDVLRRTGTDNLFVIPSGPIPPNPTEMLGSKQMKDLLAELSREFDMILFDSPPVLAVTDAAVLNSAVDATLLVVELGRSRASGVVRAIDLLEKVKANLLGIVTNNIFAGYKYDYGYYSYYYYYSAEGKKKKRRRRSRYGY